MHKSRTTLSAVDNEKFRKEIFEMKNIKVRKAESANATAWWIVI